MVLKRAAIKIQYHEAKREETRYGTVVLLLLLSSRSQLKSTKKSEGEKELNRGLANTHLTLRSGPVAVDRRYTRERE
jgi:hypothetical protein